MTEELGPQEPAWNSTIPGIFSRDLASRRAVEQTRSRGHARGAPEMSSPHRLEYVEGSHAWGDGRVGSAEQFFDSRDPTALLYDAARRELCGNQNFTARSTRRLLDGVAMPVPRRSTEPGQPRHRREMT